MAIRGVIRSGLLGRLDRLSVLSAVALVCIGLTACSSTSETDKPWVVQYAGSSDNTWTAMHIALIDLDYTIESENRDEGKIRAVRDADGTRPGSVLNLDQIARHDMVSLYVRVSAAPGAPALDASQKEDLAQEFLTPVNALLFK